jgi:hypothetical protein
MKTFSKIVTTLAASAVLVGTSFVGSPAMAARSDCDVAGTICLVENPDWSGFVWRQYPWQINGCRSLAADGFNDKATWAVNLTDSSVGVELWDNADCTGGHVYIASGYQADLRKTDPVMNDHASGIRVVYW